MRARVKTRRPAAALVEFALVFPLFLLFVLALIEIGRAMMVSSLLTNAAHWACRHGVVSTATNSEVQNAVTEKTKGMGLATPTVAITVNGAAKDVSSALPQDEIRVTVSVPFADVTWLPFARWIGGDIRGHFSLPHE